MSRPRGLRRRLQVLLAGVLLAGVLAYAAIGAFVWWQAEERLANPPQRAADAALVLGSRAYLDGKPHPCLSGRVDTAVALAKAGVVKQLAFTGGVDSEDGRIEAKVMQERAVAQGFAGPMLRSPRPPRRGRTCRCRFRCCRGPGGAAWGSWRSPFSCGACSGRGR